MLSMYKAVGSNPQHCINQMCNPSSRDRGPEVQVHLRLEANKSSMRLKNKQQAKQNKKTKRANGLLTSTTSLPCLDWEMGVVSSSFATVPVQTRVHCEAPPLSGCSSAVRSPWPCSYSLAVFPQATSSETLSPARGSIGWRFRCSQAQTYLYIDVVLAAPTKLLSWGH